MTHTYTRVVVTVRVKVGAPLKNILHVQTYKTGNTRVSTYLI